MRLEIVPRIDVYQVTRNHLKTLKLKGSLGGQANLLVQKSNEISRASLGTVETNNHALTLSDALRKKLDVI